MPESEQQAVAVAKAFISQKYPDFDPTGRRLTVESSSGAWMVTYELPDDMLGGSPVVFIDMKTGAVIRYYRNQ